MNFGKHVPLFLATGFYIGKIPFAPGTFGALLGIPVWFMLTKFAPVISLVFLTLSIPFAIWVAHVSSKLLGQKDPGCIVIDEVVGMVVTLTGLPFDWVTCLLGFVLFRIFDILKPFPIRWVDQNVGGGAGIVLDDVLAGVAANITLRLIIQLVVNTA
jgi:phosphatidylglycerophosphatase A